MEYYGHCKIQSYYLKNDLMQLCYDTEINIFNSPEHRQQQCYWPTDIYCDADQAVFGTDSLIWIADVQNGLIKINYKTAATTSYKGQGPYSEMVYRMNFGQRTLALVPGSNENYAPNYWGGDYSYYCDNQWKYHARHTSAITQNWHNPCAVAVNSENASQIYTGSWGAGV